MQLLSRTDPLPERASPEALAECLVRRHQAGVWRYLRALGCSTDLADDLTQDTFVIVIGGRFQERSDAAPRRFLLRIARHLWLRHSRDTRRRARRLAEAADHLWERDCWSPNSRGRSGR